MHILGVRCVWRRHCPVLRTEQLDRKLQERETPAAATGRIRRSIINGRKLSAAEIVHRIAGFVVVITCNTVNTVKRRHPSAPLSGSAAVPLLRSGLSL